MPVWTADCGLTRSIRSGTVRRCPCGLRTASLLGPFIVEQSASVCVDCVLTRSVGSATVCQCPCGLRPHSVRRYCNSLPVPVRTASSPGPSVVQQSAGARVDCVLTRSVGSGTVRQCPCGLWTASSLGPFVVEQSASVRVDCVLTRSVGSGTVRQCPCGLRPHSVRS